VKLKYKFFFGGLLITIVVLLYLGFIEMWVVKYEIFAYVLGGLFTIGIITLAIIITYGSHLDESRV